MTESPKYTPDNSIQMRTSDTTVFDAKKVESNGWITNIHAEPKTMPEDLIRQGADLLREWQTHFPKEGTWVQQNYGVPSLITRIDATEINGKLIPYEVEDRPAGIGLAYQHNQTFRDRLDELRNREDEKTRWPQFGVVISPLRQGHDDNKWAKIVEPNTPGLVYIRAEPYETDFHHLEPQSISTLKSEGDKSYGVQMGLWEEKSWDSDTKTADLPWDQAFVVKPTYASSKAKDILLWIPKSDPRYKQYTMPGFKSPQGVYTRKKINDTMERNGSMYVQPFHDPIDTGDPQHRFEIYRAFYGYDPTKKDWTYLGGFTNARNGLVVHGAQDTLFRKLQ